MAGARRRARDLRGAGSGETRGVRAGACNGGRRGKAGRGRDERREDGPRGAVREGRGAAGFPVSWGAGSFTHAAAMSGGGLRRWNIHCRTK